ncbi:phage tail protein [Mucilaginibacter conchicola]|uniref:Phage tail protein n=1 Tax=Mucilaginibacter conchicola TaxID=2303333 RepID=A0A372NQ16_9SPHI|nr:tail fiber protein [Mucilaginibacter conchicola]RFZ91026.1 phage tail protein [Mucilaginibacter conchicola]
MEPFVGEIKIFAGTFAPQGWFFCQGQTLPISQYQALFSLIGISYGGDGTQTFRLPNLGGTSPIGTGQGRTGSTYQMGQMGGNESVTLTAQQMPAHTHTVAINTEAPSTGLGDGAYLGYNANTETGDPIPFYSATATAGKTLNPQAVSVAGGSQAVNVQPPYLAMNYIIAWTGVYPSRP